MRAAVSERLLATCQVMSETARVLASLPVVEIGRRFTGPAPLVARLRSRAMTRRQRDPAAREQLKKIIAWVDARLPAGANCYRRSLLEVALDRGAAQEPLFMGLSSDGGPRSGHAWLGDHSDGRDYDAVISL